MAIKFSQFVTQTSASSLSYIVGYAGADNIQITPTDFFTSFATGTTGFIPKWTSSSNLGDSILEVNSALPNDVLMPQYIRHAGDTNSYFGFHSNDTFIVATNNNEVMRVTSAGNVGIGTNAPVSKLDVVGGVTAQGTLVATGISQLGSSGTNVYLTSSGAGNVGIGTSAPAKKLHVRGSAPWIRIEEDSASNKRLDLYVDPSTAIAYIGANQSAQQLRFQTGNTDRLNITNDGHVGIGTAFPTGKLEIQRSQITTQFDRDCFVRLHPTSTTNAGGFTNMFFGTSPVNNYGVAIGGLRAGNDGTPSFSIRMLDDSITGTEVLRIDNPGNATFAGTVTAGSYFLGDDASISLATTGAGTVFLRPNGQSTSGQMKVESNGNATFAGSIVMGGATLANGYMIEMIPTGGNILRSTRGSSVFGSYQSTDGPAYFGTTSSDDFVLITNDTARLTLNAAGNATFAGSATIRKSSLGGSTPMADGSLVLGAGSTDYYSFRLDSNADLYLDKSFAGTAANVLSIDRSSTNGNITFAGDVTVSGTSFLDGLVTIDHNLNIQNNGVLKMAGTEVISATRGISATTGAFTGDVSINKPTGSVFNLRRNDTSVVSGDDLGSIFFQGNDPSNPYKSGVAILGQGDGTWNMGTPNVYPSRLVFQTAEQDILKTAMVIKSDQKVGIGTTTPSYTLVVSDNGGSGAEFIPQTTNNRTTLLSYNRSGGAYNTLDFDASDIHFNISGSEKMRVDSSGNLLVGKTASDFAVAGAELRSNGQCVFTADGDNSLDLNRLTNDGAIAIFRKDNSVIGSLGSNTTGGQPLLDIAGAAGNSNIRFLTTSTERMRINSSGYIYVNTNGAEPSASQVGVRITGTQGQAFWNSANSGTTGYNHFNFYNANGAVGSIVTNGSATAFNTSSDYRLKEDLKDFDGLDKVSKIPVYDFKWKVDDSRSYGVMAHELQEVLPDAVSGEKDAEEMQGVDYSKIVPLLIKSIQELEARVKTLENK